MALGSERLLILALASCIQQKLHDLHIRSPGEEEGAPCSSAAVGESEQELTLALKNAAALWEVWAFSAR